MREKDRKEILHRNKIVAGIRGKQGNIKKTEGTV